MSDDRAELFAKGADSTLTLLILAAAAIVLMVLDRRLEYAQQLRKQTLRMVQPIWQLAALPGDVITTVHDYTVDRSKLSSANAQLATQVMAQQSEIMQLRAHLAENQRIEQLIGKADVASVRGQLARVIDVDLDRNTHRIAIDRGSNHGVQLGSVLIDQHGIMGRVVEVFSSGAIASILTDPHQRLPVQIERNGLRLYLDGTGNHDTLEIQAITSTSDIKVGDRLVSSGMGGVFPNGLPAGTITSIERDISGFLHAVVTPTAALQVSREILLLPPVPKPAVAPPPVPVVAASISTSPTDTAPATATDTPATLPSTNTAPTVNTALGAQSTASPVPQPNHPPQ